MLKILTKGLEDFVAGRWDDSGETLSNDYVYQEIATGRRGQGKESYLDVVRGREPAVPAGRFEFLGGFESGDQSIAEVEWQGTQSGPLEGPFGVIPATNRRVRVKAALIAKVRDDKLVEEHHYFDMFSLLTQLGIAPSVQTA